MAKGVNTCDWLKRAITDDELVTEITLGEKTYIFCEEGYGAMLAFLDGVENITPSAPVEDTSRTLLPDDVKAPPPRTREEADQIVAESQVAEEFSLDVLSDRNAHREAQKKLAAINAQHNLAQKRAARDAGSKHHEDRGV